jgi:hypothetical protein
VAIDQGQFGFQQGAHIALFHIDRGCHAVEHALCVRGAPGIEPAAGGSQLQRRPVGRRGPRRECFVHFGGLGMIATLGRGLGAIDAGRCARTWKSGGRWQAGAGRHQQTDDKAGKQGFQVR